MRLDGAPFSPRSPLAARRKGVAMIYQELSLAPHLSVMENVVLGMEPARAGFVDWTLVRAAARGALEQLQHLEIAPEAIVGTLSVAQQQLVEIARALAASCASWCSTSDEQPVAGGRRSGCSRWWRGSSSAATRSSTSRTSSRR